jgi:myo-inositol-1(or 4)-monophosphatase
MTMDTVALDPSIAERFEVARTLIGEAGELANSYFGRLVTLAVHSKGPQDVVSEADIAVEDLIKQHLAKAFPEDAFFGEETGYTQVAGSRGIWVVDPIDGTQPFLSGMKSWCISIAYMRDGALQFGLVNCPADQELFSGGVGIPATLNGRPIAPHAGTALTDGVVMVGYSPRSTPDVILGVLSRLLHAGGMYFRNGSGAVGLCYVACGRLLGYVEPHINSWDCLGAIAVIEAAGGQVSDFLAGDGLRSGNSIIAAPPAMFEALEQVLSPAQT